MQRRNFLKSIGLISASAVIPVTETLAGQDKRFESAGIRGKVTSNGKGIANVVVSDGYDVVMTDKDGNYSLTSNYNAEFVFVSLLSGHAIPHKEGIASFYSAIDKNQKQQKIDFALSKLQSGDTKHAFIVWGDTQIQSKEDAELLKTISAPDTKAMAVLLSNVPVHGIGCGDLVFDKFELFADYKQAVATTGIPFFQLIGNHDMDYTVRTDEGSQSTFKSHFGPTYYSFNRGKIHYVVLDNVFFIGAGHRYIGYITENQLSWLEKDLRHVPKGNTIVVSLHIPTDNGEKRRNNATEESLSGVTSNRDALYKLLKDYKVHIMSGHTHFNENWEKDNIMEHNHGTVCGAWWCGPVCGDGTPNGYGVYEVDGDEIKWFYKSVGFDKNHQLVLHKKGTVEARPDAIVANIWNWDDKWKVEWSEDGVTKGAMEQIAGRDPVAVQLYKGPDMPVKHKWVEPNLTDHLFAITPSTGAKKVIVKATDRFGNIYSRTIDLV
jgi:hypothetical protein